MASTSRHVYHLDDATPFYQTDLGSIRAVTATELPILKNLLIKHLKLAPGSIRAPYWHVNANELAYCLKGSLLVSILDSGSEFASFTISGGEMFHIESGSLHHIDNIGSEEAECIIAFRHEQLEDFSLQASFGAMTDAVLGNTYDGTTKSWSRITRGTNPRWVIKRNGKPDVPSTVGLLNSHKFNVEGMSLPTVDAVDSARTARSQIWPALYTMSMYTLRVAEDGMREPHWHPQTAKMGYIHRGRACMSILDPDGLVDTYTLGPGDMYFIPRAYPHQIEVMSDEEIHFFKFFDQPMPQDVGYRASATGMSGEFMAATFNVKGGDLPVFPLTPKDPLIVGIPNRSSKL